MKELIKAILLLLIGMAIEFAVVVLCWSAITSLLCVPFIMRHCVAVWVALIMIRMFTYRKRGD